MVICFSCDETIKEKLDLLVNKGGYSGYTAAISAAIENQLLLEEHVTKSGKAILLETRTEPPRTPVPAKQAAQESSRSNADREGSGVFAPFGLVEFSSVPTLADMPADDLEGPITPDKWLFGQYNKLLPIKANCRLVGRLLHESPTGVSLQAIAEAVQHHMPDLRKWLSDLDANNDRGREAALATAFPSKDTKSILRYMNQFVMAINKSGVLSGFLAALGFLNRLDAKATRVSLTDAGLRFALLGNPILDQPHTPDERFSTEEIRFLIEHVRTLVPRENAAYEVVLRAIARGASTPESLDVHLRTLLNNACATISDPYLSTQRSGVISRMSDLGLISRRREGIRVTYCLTETGRAYINEDETAVA